MAKRLSVGFPAVIAALAFVGVAVVFACETQAFRAAVLTWAGNDLESRTRIAVETLREPLQSGDFAAVHRFSDECAVDRIRLSVFGKPRGLVFDSLGGPDAARREGAFLFGPPMDAGAFTIRLALPRDHVLATFRRARRSFVFAALLGVTGVFLFFAVIWRQRLRLREMARVERFRREFVADVSHEIKTPLTGILGAVELLEADAGGAREKAGPTAALLVLIKRESRRLNRLVQSILDLARLEREGDVLRLATVDPVELVRGVAARCGVRFAVGAASRRVPAEGIRLDAQLVDEALTNLIVNAQRHAGTDDIAVTFAWDGKTARIFERFHRVDPSRAAETGGAGLGLAIVRRIARLHGGDADYRPAEPCGSVFTLTLPSSSPGRDRA